MKLLLAKTYLPIILSKSNRMESIVSICITSLVEWYSSLSQEIPFFNVFFLWSFLLQIHIDETRGTLQFASRAKRVTNCAQVNETVTDAALLKRQKREIEELLQKLQGSPHSEDLEKEIRTLRNDLLQVTVYWIHQTCVALFPSSFPPIGIYFVLHICLVVDCQTSLLLKVPNLLV
jgi:hypothetical protein